MGKPDFNKRRKPTGFKQLKDDTKELEERRIKKLKIKYKPALVQLNKEYSELERTIRLVEELKKERSKVFLTQLFICIAFFVAITYCLMSWFNLTLFWAITASLLFSVFMFAVDHFAKKIGLMEEIFSQNEDKAVNARLAFEEKTLREKREFLEAQLCVDISKIKD